MQLDRTFISIRQRSMLERWDLTLLVMRRYFRQICVLFAVGILPWMILNHLLTMWMVSGDYFSDHVGWFYWINLCLVATQAQIGTCWISLFLGTAMFQQRPETRDTIKRVRRAGLWFWWMHLVNRMVLPVVAVVALLLFFEGEEPLIFFGVPVLGGLMLWSVILRSMTPFMNEIVLLERAPRKSDGENQLSYSVRSSLLRNAPGADFFGNFTVSLLVGALLTLAIYESLCLVDQVLNLQSLAKQNLNYVYWQFSLWVVAAIISVNRFLSYIDLRIRTEGWAVRLRLIAENKRQLGETAIG